MKKFLLLALAVVLVFSFAACEKQEEVNESGINTVEVGKLKVGMDLQYPPFETFDDNNNPIGISVDVAQDFADNLGLELEVVNMDFSTLIPSLETGDIDIAIASMSITEEREEKVDFTNPYFYFKIIGLMNADYAEANGLTSESSSDDLWAVAETKFIGLAGQISTNIPQSHGFEVQESVDKAAAITEVSTGRSDMLVISPEVVIGAHEAYSDTTEIFWSALDVSPIGMAVVEGNTELLDLANDFISKMDDEGSTYDKVREKYLEDIQALFGADATMDFYIYED